MCLVYSTASMKGKFVFALSFNHISQNTCGGRATSLQAVKKLDSFPVSSGHNNQISRRTNCIEFAKGQAIFNFKFGSIWRKRGGITSREKGPLLSQVVTCCQFLTIFAKTGMGGKNQAMQCFTDSTYMVENKGLDI